MEKLIIFIALTLFVVEAFSQPTGDDEDFARVNLSFQGCNTDTIQFHKVDNEIISLDGVYTVNFIEIENSAEINSLNYYTSVSDDKFRLKQNSKYRTKKE